VIVVGIWNTNDRTNEYTYSYDPAYKFGGKGDLYLDFIQQELEPIVRQKWFPNRVKLGGYSIGGSSLGGLISCYAMYKRSDFFANAICMSSSFWWNSEDFTNKVLTNSYNNNTKVYLDSGDAGDSQDGKNQTLTVKAHMEKIGYANGGKDENLWYYLDKGGQHNEYYWGKRFHVPMMALFGSAPKV
jgi:predicted alpha/beta superfamily hydrolase